MGEARAQLECHGTFVETMVEEDAASSEALALVDRTRAGLVAIGQVSNQCETVHQKLMSLRRADQVAKSPLKAIMALGGLAGLEQPAAEAFKTLKLISDILERRMEAGDWDAEDSMHEVPPLRIRFRACLARAVREARSIAQALPPASPVTLKARRCRPDLLVKVEQLAILEAEAEGDPGVIFSAGLLMSEASMTANDVPFFGTKPSRSDWSLDSRGFRVPTGIANAEDMLWKGFQASFGPDETERAALRAIRICQHAKMLVQLKLDAAAEWRYRAGAELASKYGRHKLASHCLAQLSYFLYVNGFEEKALDVADEAVTLGSDPLASYLQVMLRSNLGLLRTDGETRSAAKQLAELQGQLHAKELEETRTSIHANLVFWEGVSEAGTISSCFSLGDSAQVLICVLARFAYM